MNWNQINKRLAIALKLIEVNDNHLTLHDVNERSISHRFAIYLEFSFGKEYNVDCEYNKNIEHGHGIKKIEILESKWKKYHPNRSEQRSFSEDEILIEKSVYPDIIVHRRGSNDHNLLIIEIKKSSSRISEEYDFEKLKCYKTEILWVACDINLVCLSNFT